MTMEQRKLAISWYVQGIDLITIGQHFGLSYEEIKAELHNQ